MSSEPPGDTLPGTPDGRPPLPDLEIRPGYEAEPPAGGDGAGAAAGAAMPPPPPSQDEPAGNAASTAQQEDPPPGAASAAASSPVTPVAPAGTAPGWGSQPRLRCTVIGPSKVGKSHLLDSCDQACADPAAYDLPVQLEFLGATMTKAEGSFLLAPTDDVSVYEADLTATWPATFWRPEKRMGLELRVTDGPGGALFPTADDRVNPNLPKWERDMLDGSRQADALVLCVDSTKPELDRISRFLRDILAKVAERQPVSAPSLPPGHRLLKALGRAFDPPPDPLRRIQARRFLLLLTKIDRLVSAPLDGAPQWSGKGPVPRDLARSLSPLALACELVDASNLMRILAALKPDAELAVGLTSAWGFNEAGYPFMEDDSPVRLSTQPADRKSSDWRPFGVREALLFLLEGRTGGPVERVTRRKVARSGRHFLDVPAWYFD